MKEFQANLHRVGVYAKDASLSIDPPKLNILKRKRKRGEAYEHLV